MKKTLLLVCLLLLACLAQSAQVKGEPGLCEKKARVMLDKVLEMWNKPDLALIPELYSTDTVATTSSTPVPYVGHEGIKQWVENTRIMLPDMKMTFDEAVVQGDKIATIWTLTGTNTGPMQTPGGAIPPSAKPVRITGLAIDYLKDGKFVKEVVMFNALEMLMQMGFTLNPPQPVPVQ
jgi:predicted ester cyclase